MHLVREDAWNVQTEAGTWYIQNTLYVNVTQIPGIMVAQLDARTASIRGQRRNGQSLRNVGCSLHSLNDLSSDFYARVSVSVLFPS
jgi:hypothetical protein